MPIVSIDWGALKERLGGATFLVALTDRQVSMLLTLSEQLGWRKTFRTADYDWADVDDLDTEIDDLRSQLIMPVSLTSIIQYIDEIEALLQGIQELQRLGGCCDNTAPVGEEHTSPNADNYPDTPPAEWGDGEAIVDSADWQELVCGAAHAYVDLLKATSDELDGAVKSAALVVGGIAGLMALLTGAGILLAVAWTAAASIVSGLVAGATAATFEGSSDELEAARADIVCAIVHGDAAALRAEIEAAVSGLAWTLWFQFVDYDSAWATMIDGGNNQGFLPVDRRSDCECTPDWSCENNLITDCSFESGGVGAGWYWVPGDYYPEFLTDNAYDGTYAARVQGFVGSLAQEFTPTVTASHHFSWYSHRDTGTGSTQLTLEYWNGSSWVNVVTWNMNPAAGWQPSNQWRVLTAGQLYRVRWHNSWYHRFDKLVVWPD